MTDQADRPLTPEHLLNGWRELGEEVQRVVDLMTVTQRDDWFPDWFVPRLAQLLRAQPAPPADRPSAREGLFTAWLDEQCHHAGNVEVADAQRGDGHALAWSRPRFATLSEVREEWKRLRAEPPAPASQVRIDGASLCCVRCGTRTQRRVPLCVTCDKGPPASATEQALRELSDKLHRWLERWADGDREQHPVDLICDVRDEVDRLLGCSPDAGDKETT